jgi:hypothetical protein
MFYGDLLEKRRTEAEKEQEKFVAQIIYIFISSPILLLSVFFRLLLNFFKISSKFVSSNPVHGDVYSIQHYVTKFGSAHSCQFFLGYFLISLRFLLNL